MAFHYSQILVLCAKNLGLDTCWVSWFVQKDIRPILNIPSDKYVVSIITLGYSNEEPKAPSRKNLEDIIHYENW
jgi:nitroreductase